MHEERVSSPSLSAILALAARIERESSRFVIRDVFASPYPFIEVKDTVHGIVVGFSCEADYVTYCQIMTRTQGGHHA